jgi:hypothetical protein
MQLSATYTRMFQDGDINSQAAICTVSRSIVRCDVSDDCHDDMGSHTGDSVQVEHNGIFYDFECDQGELTTLGKKQFEAVLDGIMLKVNVDHDNHQTSR